MLAFRAGRMPSTTRTAKLTGEARDRGENDVDDILVRLAVHRRPRIGEAEDAQSRRQRRLPSSPCRSGPPVPKPGPPAPRQLLCREARTVHARRVLQATSDATRWATPCRSMRGYLSVHGRRHHHGAGFSPWSSQKKASRSSATHALRKRFAGNRERVYNGYDFTLCVLDNATTAMTGSQPHPGTGVTLMGERQSRFPPRQC